MQFDDVLKQRRSIRQFKPDPVADEVLRQVLERALQSPSSSNTQAYRIAVASGALKDQLREALSRKFAAANKINRAPLPLKIAQGLLSKDLPDGDFKPTRHYAPELKQRASVCGHGLYSTLGIARDDWAGRDRQMQRNYEFFDAPTVIFLFVHQNPGIYAALDAGIFLQSLMLSATRMGLGTCAQGALGLWAGPVRERFEVEPDYKLLCGLSMGYVDERHPVNGFQPAKRPLEQLLLPPKGR